MAGRTGRAPSHKGAAGLRRIVARLRPGFLAAVLLACAFAAAMPATAADSLAVQASEAFGQGEFRRAIDLTDQAFAAGEVSSQAMPTTLAIRAMAYSQLGEAEAAWADVDRALASDRRDYFANFGAAAVALQLGEARRGLPFANTALRQAPALAYLWQLRANLLESLDQAGLAEADRQYARLLQDQPGLDADGEAYARYDCLLGADLRCAQGLFPLVVDNHAGPGTAALLGYLLLGLDAADDGRQLLDWAGQAEPQAPETWLYAGLAALRDGNAAVAREAFLQALARDPLDPRAGLGLIAASPGDGPAAVAEWERLGAGLPLEESHHAIFALQATADWERAADHATELFHADLGPFAMVAVAMLGGDSLAAERSRALLGAAITPQQYLPDTFTRQLALIERERLAGG